MIAVYLPFFEDIIFCSSGQFIETVKNFTPRKFVAIQYLFAHGECGCLEVGGLAWCEKTTRPSNPDFNYSCRKRFCGCEMGWEA